MTVRFVQPISTHHFATSHAHRTVTATSTGGAGVKTPSASAMKVTNFEAGPVRRAGPEPSRALQTGATAPLARLESIRLWSWDPPTVPRALRDRPRIQAAHPSRTASALPGTHATALGVQLALPGLTKKLLATAIAFLVQRDKPLQREPRTRRAALALRDMLPTAQAAAARAQRGISKPRSAMFLAQHALLEPFPNFQRRPATPLARIVGPDRSQELTGHLSASGVLQAHMRGMGPRCVTSAPQAPSRTRTVLWNAPCVTGVPTPPRTDQ